ncbi:transcription elongation factor NusA [Marinitoga sp. 1135]|uniref:Transcription termination/antitermination protein NusA n=1 Tax=Marinitoga piezophila (strain DSM 14283 / JCM 11233 / KA3) TaxID=443254 RepID=H2J7P0_MARPK|nr:MULTISPECIES: transcription termination factor NusA [Marinitoga]AEX85381.1 transcription termination factor NusA [Marinitoga piezophila KA3]APT75857.1 transcription elongation factor NusA [Marinitoga sp. 1137]NUU95605.1 transcription elongation factor NusA [Marinitoga sp. 1135]NUU97515.1 transcription elongation factor NusA [Marinitoga sp. 1138]
MNLALREALTELEREKGIKKEVLLEIIEKAIEKAYKNNYEMENVEVIVDKNHGEITIYQLLKVVEEVENEGEEITLEEAKKISSKAQIGDIIKKKINPKKEFKRIAAQTAKQVIKQSIREIEKEKLYQTYSTLEGKITTAEVLKVTPEYADIRIGKLETKLPAKEWIPGEKMYNGDIIKVYIKSVQKTTKGPKILVSRSVPEFVEELFKMNIPEIEDGIVKIKKIYREPGVRSKVAVYSEDPKVDAIGACIGENGMRIAQILEDLKNLEKIDVIKWSDDIEELIRNALAPAQVVEIKLDKKEKFALVHVPENQLSLAIGKGGQNARAAAKITGWKIDIHTV